MGLKLKGKTNLIFIILTIIFLVYGVKWVLFDVNISEGKRVGNLVKISKKGKLLFLKTWEGTLDEGSGDKLTYYFSVKNEKIAQELYSYQGRQVTLYYEQHFFGWPRETDYEIVAWRPKQAESISSSSSDSLKVAISEVSKTLFCSFLGTLFKDKDLYVKVKNFVKLENMYVYKQYDKCNE
jgi:hypothetical protein